MREDTPRRRKWVVRKSASGTEHRVFVWDDMPRQNDAYLRCSIYLYRSEKEAREGADEGGSGCLVGVRSELDPFGLRGHLYAVTNRHVVKDEGCQFIRYNTMPDGSDVLLTEGSWTWDKEDDLAVAPVELPAWARYMSIGLDYFSVTPEKIEEYNIGLGDDVFMVGRLLGNEGKGRDVPALRFGNISRMPDADEPIEIGGRKQEAYLVEMRSISGYSGSPVFFYAPMHSVPDNNMKERRGWAIGPLLLGIDCGHLRENIAVRTSAGRPHPDGSYVHSNSGMAAVIPVWRLRRLLNSRRLLVERREKDEQRLAEKQRGRGGFDADYTAREESEGITREGFEDALRKAFPRPSESESGSDET